ncbi:SAM-dependent methyltransferase [Streptomyces sp. NBRC 110465]|uniref:SAM-dependent methyltransferase n=1 Tax=Streptomyces sp. NBRC 110465 TaxID=1897621 RepID=UPI000934737D|nr:SAM-dependent methyltransferase [Streptomyces sp. NBRC 110465]
MTAQELTSEASRTRAAATGPQPDRPRTVAPWAPAPLLAMRAFTFHSARYLTRRYGIAQFISLCSPDGPGAGAVLRVRRPCDGVPDASFVHVAPPASPPRVPGRACTRRHDHTVFHGVLPLLRAHAVETLDRQRPVGILLDGFGPWATSFADLQFTLNTLRGWLPPRSAIALTHTTDDDIAATRWHARPRRRRAAAVLTREGGYSPQPLPRAQIRSLLEPWPLTEHGLVPTSAFLGDLRHAALSTRPCGSYAAIALHPEAT